MNAKKYLITFGAILAAIILVATTWTHWETAVAALVGLLAGLIHDPPQWVKSGKYVIQLRIHSGKIDLKTTIPVPDSLSGPIAESGADDSAAEIEVSGSIQKVK